MVDLGTFGGSFSGAYDINDAGQLVGWSSTSAGDTHAFIWTKAGGMVDLRTLGGSSSYATEINDGGQVVGSSTNAAGDQRAVVWNPIPQVSVSGKGRFNTEGNGQVYFTLSNQAVNFDRTRGERFSFAGEVASVTGEEKTATLTGKGSWNGKSGYAFEAAVVDKAPAGKLKDTIEVVIRNPAGAVVFTSFGPQVIKQGDISVTPGRFGLGEGRLTL